MKLLPFFKTHSTPRATIRVASLLLFGCKSFSEASNKTFLGIEKWKELAVAGCTIIDTRSDNEQLKKGTEIVIEGYIKDAYLLPEAGTLPNWLSVLFNPKNELLVFANKNKVDEISIKVKKVGLRVAGFNSFSIE